MKKLTYCFPFLKEINGSLDTKLALTPLLSRQVLGVAMYMDDNNCSYIE